MNRRKIITVVLAITGGLAGFIVLLAVIGSVAGETSSTVPTRSENVTQQPQAPAESPDPSGNGVIASNEERCGNAIAEAALQLDKVDTGVHDNPYDVCAGSNADILNRIKDQAAAYAKLPR